MLKNLYAFIFAIFVGALSFAQTADVQRYIVLPPNSQGFMLPVLLWDKGSYASWTPSRADIEGLEARLSVVSGLKIRGYESTALRIDRPEKYFRQYVGVRHGGRHQIYINAFCDDPPPSNWKKTFYVVIDGDLGYWHAFYDPDTKTFSDLTINPRA